MIALKCETDFVAKNADFVALTQAILDAAIANKCQTLDEVKALPMGNGTVADAVVERSGVTGEKTELDGLQLRIGRLYCRLQSHEQEPALYNRCFQQSMRCTGGSRNLHADCSYEPDCYR